MKRNLVVVTGGAGFVGTNLINYLVKNTKYKILSIDDYSVGSKKNHNKSSKVSYINSKTNNIDKILKNKASKVQSLFHFGEFSRIFQSFKKFDECFNSNSLGTLEVFKFCLKYKIKLIYSATSASLGLKKNNKNSSLSPYAFSKEKNLELLQNLKKWFNFKYEIIYFYNVYGPNQICKGNMATVIGIFQEKFKNNQPLPVVLPGNQSRRFTHIEDTIDTCFEAWKRNKNSHYSISNKKSFTILEVAKLFSKKIKFLPTRPGERYASALTRMNLSNKVLRRFGKKSLSKYISDYKKSLN